MNLNLSFLVLTANIISILLIGTLYFSNRQKLSYQLSASMGHDTVNLSNETVDDFMNCIDKQMYRDKLKYYEDHDRRKRP